MSCTLILCSAAIVNARRLRSVGPWRLHAPVARRSPRQESPGFDLTAAAHSIDARLNCVTRTNPFSDTVSVEITDSSFPSVAS